ncbi:MAG TPA: cobalamin-independent methionine synthase II family protein [Burkholderiales bacterium]|nr:cobalamin-independent methionine synthase II family protein [Burkholderiales bacterium]
MKPSIDRIRTTHTGSLPRPADMLAALHARFEGGRVDEAAYEKALARNVREIVRKQVEAGIDVVSDGECSKPSFMAYRAERIGGFEPRIPKGGMPAPGPVDPDGRDATMFPEYYRNVQEHSPFAKTVRVAPRVCVAPIRYVGEKFLQRDLANLRQAMSEAGAEEGFMPSASPIPGDANEHYRSEAEYFEAHGEAMREEYRAILDTGLYLQIDDPRMVSSWDSRKDMDLAQYRAWMQGRIEHLNHALRGFPEERIRYHTCYGVNFGPRLSDLQLEQVLDLILTIRAGAYSFEAANPRHDHEWRVAQKLELPEGKMLIPGAVTHSNVTIEHPEGVADRIERWARAAGRENVMFGNDCGFASTAGNTEIPEAVAWAKLKSLGEGARIASRRLWAR